MKISVIGQGYVGLNVAMAASLNFDVVGYDINSEIVEKLNLGKSHIEDISESVLQDRISKSKYRASNSPVDLKDSEIIVIAVPTPLTHDRKPDLTFLENACRIIGENLSTQVLIINESTSYPGTLRNFIKPKVENYSLSETKHLYAISPERVDPGNNEFKQKNTPRIFSGLNAEASQKTREFYSKFCDVLFEVSSPEVAEAAKLFENTFRQVNIALVNEFAQISHAIGFDVHETLKAAATKPYGFMRFFPSAGVGGHCIPVDPTYLATVAEDHGAPATFIRRANEVNLQMPRYIVDRIKADNGGSVSGKKILVVGVSYKPNVADVRETPALLVIQHLKNEGALVSWHDEVVKSWKNEKSSPLSDADISVVVTKHDSVSVTEILQSASYVFDSTGKITGAHQL